MKPVYITARDLPEAWFLCIKEVIEQGKDYKITKGSCKDQKRRQLDYVTIHVKYPGTIPLIPDIPPGLGIPPPVDEEYVKSYLGYLMTDLKKPNEDYTYGQRLNNPTVKIKNSRLQKILTGKKYKDYKMGVNQIEEVIKSYREGGHGQNQCTMEIGMPSDIKLEDPPCLRIIDMMVLDGRLNFFTYFRSWDLWGGFPANLAGLQLLKEYMAASIGVEDGELIAASKGLHLYDHYWEIAYIRLGKFGKEIKK